MREEVFLAGTGGQGVLSAGQMLAQVAMEADYQVSYLPLYSPEVRGGTATATIVFSDEAVGSPVLGTAGSLVLFAARSVDDELHRARPGGLVVSNVSLTGHIKVPDEVRLAEVPATEIATELGFEQVTNMVMLGAYIAAADVLGLESFEQALRSVLPERHHKHIPLNMEALKRGADCARG